MGFFKEKPMLSLQAKIQAELETLPLFSQKEVLDFIS